MCTFEKKGYNFNLHCRGMLDFCQLVINIFTQELQFSFVIYFGCHHFLSLFYAPLTFRIRWRGRTQNNSTRPMRSYPKVKNHSVSLISEILTDKQKDCNYTLYTISLSLVMTRLRPKLDYVAYMTTMLILKIIEVVLSKSSLFLFIFLS